MRPKIRGTFPAPLSRRVPRGQFFILRPRLGPSGLRNTTSLEEFQRLLCHFSQRLERNAERIQVRASHPFTVTVTVRKTTTVVKKNKKKTGGVGGWGGQAVNNGPSRFDDGTNKLPHLRAHTQTHTHSHRYAPLPGERCCKPNLKKK